MLISRLRESSLCECVCVSLWPACHSYPTPCSWHTPPSSGACCLHLCGNPTMSTMQHKSDNAVVVLSDSGGKSCAAGSPSFAAPAPAPALSCCVVPHKNSSFLAFSLCYATSHSSTSTPRSCLVPLFTCFWLLFYVRNLHWPLCRRLLHFCFFCTAKRWKTKRKKTKRKR